MTLSFSFIEQIWFLGIAFFVLFLPGMVWVTWRNSHDKDMVEQLADAVGISIALIASIALIFYLAGWKFNGLILFLFFAFGLLAVLAALLRHRDILPRKQVLTTLSIFAVLLLMVAWRSFQARSLAFPAWVDSVHHVLVIQKILDVHGLPATLAPELPVPFTYHYGFHIVTALWSSISRLNPTDSVLWLGQVLNALLALGIYRLAKVFWKDWRIAVIAALLTTFALQMPAYYLTWGRYTLITGLLVMLPAMAAALEVVGQNAKRETVLRLVVLTAGLGLVHYMALLFLGLFVAVVLIERFICLLRQRREQTPTTALVKGRDLWRLALAALTGILLALPWLLPMLRAQGKNASVAVSIPDWQNFKNMVQYIIYLLGPQHNYWLLGLSALGFLLAILQRRAKELTLWTTLLLILSVPWGLKLGPFRPDHMAIILFIPAALLLAYFLVQVFVFVSRRLGWHLGQAFLILSTGALLLWGGLQTRSVINPVTVLADQSDRRALDWIATNISSDARFFANVALWQFRTYRGVDGGYWITPYTRRFSIALPSLYTSANRVQYDQWESWLSTASQVSTCDSTFWSLVRDANLGYVYSRENKGSLQPSGLEGCETIEQIYEWEGVHIYQIRSIP
ncbi:MAG: hypothetical protein BGO78_10265 [Chloroflexi bacterium 44-23]|nr:MAG: hypothetical protein BGO78_10265 [Chloroflexi bacterium 44-23]